MKCMKWHEVEYWDVRFLDNKPFLGKGKISGAGGQSGLEMKVTKVKEIKQYEYKLLFN